MKKIISLVLAGIIVLAGVGGATWATFNDQATSTSNTITAGTLYMTPSMSATGTGAGAGSLTGHSGAEIGHINFASMKPGDSGSYTWDIQNTGTLAGTLSATFASTFTPSSPAAGTPAAIVRALTNGGGTNATVFEGANGGLGNFLGVKVTYQVGTSQGGTQVTAVSYSTGLGTSGTYVAASQLISATISSVSVPAGDWCRIILNWQTPNTTTTLYGPGTDSTHILTYASGNGATQVTYVSPYNTDNIWQGDTGAVTVTFSLVQS